MTDDKEHVRQLLLSLPSYEKLKDIERYIVDVYSFIEEVDNGGLDQFFL